jgi:tetratricopeptide (TPR) repeat protein
MRANVLNDQALVKHAGQFVWLSIDIEKAANAPFLEKFPSEGVPTFLIVDPATRKPVLKWLGTANVGQLEKLMDDGVRASFTAPPTAAPNADVALGQADRLNAAGKSKEAIPAYEEAIKQGGPDWARRPRALESLVTVASLANENEKCAQIATEFGPSMGRSSSFANVVGSGLQCAMAAPPQAAWGTSSIRLLKPLTEEALALPGLFADDRSGIYEILIGLARQDKDEQRVHQLAIEWLDFLDREEKNAASAEARAAADGWRVTAALDAGQPARALPALLASERDLPGDYNPPARLARIYQELGQYDKALVESDRALANVYGPRKLNVMQTRIRILEKKGDRVAAKQAIVQAIQYASALPKPQMPQTAIASLQKQLTQYQ